MWYSIGAICWYILGIGAASYVFLDNQKKYKD